MQIHELSTFTGTPTSTDYLAIDDGTVTYKVGADGLGVRTAITQAEAEAGTATDLRLVTAAVFKAAVDSLADTVTDDGITQTTRDAYTALGWTDPTA